MLLAEIESFIRYKKYPVGMVSRGDKANFRRACKKFNMTNEQYRKGEKLVITCKNRQRDIVHDVHEGLGDSAKAAAMGSHRGRTSTYEIISEILLVNISNDVANYRKILLV